MNVLNATINLLDPVVTWKGDGSAGRRQTQLSLQTVEDSSEGAVANLQLEMAVVFVFCSLYTRVQVSSFWSPRAESHLLRHQIPVCASETWGFLRL